MYDLKINGQDAVAFIKEAYGLDGNENGYYDLYDPKQQALRHVRDWITMAESDALLARRGLC